MLLVMNDANDSSSDYDPEECLCHMLGGISFEVALEWQEETDIIDAQGSNSGNNDTLLHGRVDTSLSRSMAKSSSPKIGAADTTIT